MNERILNVDETLAALKTIDSLDLEQASKKELQGLIKNLNKHIAVVSSLAVGRVIIRTVSCKYLRDNPIIYPTKISQISFNPNADSCGFNRASWKGETMFYGSVATNMLQPYTTSSFEVLTDLQDSEAYMDRETFVIGKWVVKKEIPLVHISGKLKNNEMAASTRYDTFYKSINQYPESVVPLKLIDSFLCKEFVKTVPHNERWRYKISAAYTDFVKQDHWPGVIYPSLQSDGAGYNVALFPDTLSDYITFERAVLTTYYKRGKNIVNEITMEAFPNGEVLKWQETYRHKLPPNIRRWYTGLSDDNSFEQYIGYVDL